MNKQEKAERDAERARVARVKAERSEARLTNLLANPRYIFKDESGMVMPSDLIKKQRDINGNFIQPQGGYPDLRVEYGITINRPKKERI